MYFLFFLSICSAQKHVLFSPCQTGEGPHLPFSQMPSKCGFLVKRSRRDVHFAAPYHGCHVTQQVRLITVFLFKVCPQSSSIWVCPHRLQSCGWIIVKVSIFIKRLLSFVIIHFPPSLWQQLNVMRVAISRQIKSIKLLAYDCAVLAFLHHFTLQGGKYVLPLRLWGAPVTMSCPAEPPPPPPSVVCFPSGMVVNVGGITANELKIKGRWHHFSASENLLEFIFSSDFETVAVSDMWRPLSSVCGTCGFAIEVLSGGLKLTVPYNRDPCVKIEVLRALLWWKQGSTSSKELSLKTVIYSLCLLVGWEVFALSSGGGCGAISHMPFNTRKACFYDYFASQWWWPVSSVSLVTNIS